MTDEELVARFAGGDAEAFNILAARYEERLYRIACRLLGNRDDALDAVQEMLVRLMRSLPGFRGEARFSTWLYRLAANTCADYRRRLAAGRVTHALDLDADPPMAAPDEDPDRRCEREHRERLIEQALRMLPESQRLLLVLRDLEGLSNHEVADILGIEVGALKSRLHRARAALRRVLEAGVTVEGEERLGRFQFTASGALV